MARGLAVLGADPGAPGPGDPAVLAPLDAVAAIRGPRAAEIGDDPMHG
jgi:hypothetical protein